MRGRGLLLVALAATLTLLVAGVAGAFSPISSTMPDLPTAPSPQSATADTTPKPTAVSGTPVPTVIPSPTPSPRPPVPTTTVRRSATSYFASSVLISVYGRAFGTSPSLGRLGNYRNFADMAVVVDKASGRVIDIVDANPW
jgi:hypothetical protein